MKRPNTGANGDGNAPPPGSTLSSLPSLYSYLTESKWDDGQARELATITIFCQDGRWKVFLNDKATNRICCLTGQTVEEVLLSLDEGLRTDDLDWRTPKDDGRRRK